jgi:DNA (cytosine-5)-methyltransferase 1
MGVPQRRERVFFIARRKSLNFSDLKIGFHNKAISVKEAFDSIKDINKLGVSKISSSMVPIWNKCLPGESFAKHNNGSCFNFSKLSKDKPSVTLTASNNIWHYESPRSLSSFESCVLGSYPIDYKFKDEKIAGYMIGMSVPPLMTYGVANQIYKQWFIAAK